MWQTLFLYHPFRNERAIGAVRIPRAPTLIEELGSRGILRCAEQAIHLCIRGTICTHSSRTANSCCIVYPLWQTFFLYHPFRNERAIGAVRIPRAPTLIEELGSRGILRCAEQAIHLCIRGTICTHSSRTANSCCIVYPLWQTLFLYHPFRNERVKFACANNSGCSGDAITEFYIITHKNKKRLRIPCRKP